MTWEWVALILGAFANFNLFCYIVLVRYKPKHVEGSPLKLGS